MSDTERVVDADTFQRRLLACRRCGRFQESTGHCLLDGRFARIRARLADTVCAPWAEVPVLEVAVVPAAPMIETRPLPAKPPPSWNVVTLADFILAQSALAQFIPAEDPFIRLLAEVTQAYRSNGCRGCVERRYGESLAARFRDAVKGLSAEHRRKLRETLQDRRYIVVGNHPHDLDELLK